METNSLDSFILVGGAFIPQLSDVDLEEVLFCKFSLYVSQDKTTVEESRIVEILFYGHESDVVERMMELVNEILLSGE